MSFVTKHIQHHDYDFSNDLILFRLSKPADITDAVKPIGLPTEEPKLGSTCFTSGWSTMAPYQFQNAKDLQCVNLKLLPNEECAKTESEGDRCHAVCRRDGWKKKKKKKTLSGRLRRPTDL
ncbi:RIKEN cDNA 1700127D06 [Mus musculus]|nr:RIKEN cDNA 1700127D06 [Mus musculus]